MSDKITIYDLLTKSKVSEVTITQLDSATKNTAITADNVDFWSGVITVARALEESRTYGHGLPIPEASAVSSVTVADGASETIKPTGTEVWLVQSINDDECTPFLTDGSAIMPLVKAGAEAQQQGNLYLTNKLWIGFQNASGSEQTPAVAYHKVGL